MTEQRGKVEEADTASPRDFCPRCGKREGIPLVFGYPSRKMMEREANGEIFFGGCSVGPEPWPNRQCGSCDYSWVSLDDDRPMPFDIADLNEFMPETERDFYAAAWFFTKAEQAYRAMVDIADSDYWFSKSSGLGRVNFFLEDHDLLDPLEELLKILDEGGAAQSSR